MRVTFIFSEDTTSRTHPERDPRLTSCRVSHALLRKSHTRADGQLCKLMITCFQGTLNTFWKWISLLSPISHSLQWHCMLLKPLTPILLHSPSATQLISHIVEKIPNCITNSWTWELKMSTNHTCAELNPAPRLPLCLNTSGSPWHVSYVFAKHPLSLLLCFLCSQCHLSATHPLGKLLTKPHFQFPRPQDPWSHSAQPPQAPTALPPCRTVAPHHQASRLPVVLQLHAVPAAQLLPLPFQALSWALTLFQGI